MYKNYNNLYFINLGLIKKRRKKNLKLSNFDPFSAQNIPPRAN